ncbi:hypothetical protein HID58_075330 [Brassica napus]|uniref:(rape) hypothetical protein n=1 Tax=Brassica napus TaxID=3708 RepID=A0A816M7B8_BRANA|nr:hypothetical protein HID58_075330 [Brassica napus]CAF1971962.1 unnamed protein product [Brassica napus]
MSCRRSGVVEATNTAAVVIPEGLLDNMILSCLFLFNYLTSGVGSEAMVVIQGVGHARLRKRQPLGTCISNLRFLMIPESLTISRVVAILGGKVVVSTPSGKREIEVRFLPSEIYNILCVWISTILVLTTCN